MKLVVGLGNPGPRYAGTRHNVGFELVDVLAARWGAVADRYEKRFEALLGEAPAEGQRVLLCKPQTFMNLSGRSVQAVRQFYRIEPADILIASDDLDLEPGRLRLRARGSAGGQKGLTDVLARLGTTEIARLRIGIGKVHRLATVGHVLSKFAPDERAAVAATIETAADAVVCWLGQGVEAAMNRYNAWKYE